MAETTTPVAPRMFSPLTNSFGLKDQKPSGSPWNPLQWPTWFTYQKGRLNLPSPGKFERLHGEVTKGNKRAYLLYISFLILCVCRGFH
jgi:mitochondrial import receptor subunit TOM40